MTLTVEAGVRVIEAYPSATEVAVVSLPPGAVARVHHPSGELREYAPEISDEASLVVIPGDRETIGWGWAEGWYETPRGIRNGHRPMNRDAWHAAARAVQLGADVVYVRYEQRPYYGKDQWTAVGIREAVSRG